MTIDSQLRGLEHSHRGRLDARRFMEIAFSAALTLVFMATVVSSAGAQSRESDEEPGWIPYAEFAFDSSDDESSATIISTVGPGSTGSGSFDATRLRFGAGVLSPDWTPIAGEPRLFIEAAVDVFASGSERVQDVGEIGNPEDDFEDIRNTPGGTDGGQGQFVRQEYIGPAWYLAFGAAFSVPAPWDEGRIRLKPLAAYEGERVRIEGQLTQVREPTPDVFEIYRANARTNPRTDHRLGVGGEIELVFLENDQFEVSAFGNIRYMWLLGGRSTEFGDSTGVAQYEWRGSANVIRGGLGVRVGWRGL